MKKQLIILKIAAKKLLLETDSISSKSITNPPVNSIKKLGDLFFREFKKK